MFNDLCLIKYGLIDVINMLIIDYNYIVGEKKCILFPPTFSAVSPPLPFSRYKNYRSGSSPVSAH